MADYVAGRGTTAMSIIGTVLGGISALGGNAGGLLNNGSVAAYEYHNATMHDIEDAQKLAAKDAEIAQLKSEKYADAVREDAKQYSIEIYKELAGKINDMKDLQNAKWTDQMVVNAQISDAITALDGKANNTANLVAQITRTAVPQSAICNFGCNNGSCGANV